MFVKKYKQSIICCIIILIFFIMVEFGLSVPQKLGSISSNNYIDSGINLSVEDEGITGVWQSFYASGEIAYLYCFEQDGTFYHIEFWEDPNDIDCVKTIVNEGEYYDLGNGSISVTLHDEVSSYSYEIDDTSLYLKDNDDEYNNRMMYKKSVISNENSLYGEWRTFNELQMIYCLIDTMLAPKSYVFYSDGSFKFSRSEENVQRGFFRIINDGTAIELTYNGESEAYSFKFLGNGLLLLQSSYYSNYVLLEFN